MPIIFLEAEDVIDRIHRSGVISYRARTHLVPSYQHFEILT